MLEAHVFTALPVASFQSSVKFLNDKNASPNWPTEGLPMSALKPRAKKPPPGACLVPKETRKLEGGGQERDWEVPAWESSVVVVRM